MTCGLSEMVLVQLKPFGDVIQTAVITFKFVLVII